MFVSGMPGKTIETICRNLDEQLAVPWLKGPVMFGRCRKLTTRTIQLRTEKELGFYSGLRFGYCYVGGVGRESLL